MGSNRNPMHDGPADRASDDRGIATVKSRGDIGGCHDGQQRIVVTERENPEGFAEIRVEVYVHASAHLAVESGRTLPHEQVLARTKQKGTAIIAVPPCSIGLAPPAFTAPCRNQTDERTQSNRKVRA